jgi:hypothetical protein
MAGEKTYSGILGDLLRFQASMEPKMGEVPHLGPSRAILGETLGQLQDLVRRQSAVMTEKQTLSQQIQAVIGDGQRLATVLRKGLQHHYGIRSEELTQFGLQPFRGRKPSNKKKAAQPSSPLAEEAASSPE